MCSHIIYVIKNQFKIQKQHSYVREFTDQRKEKHELSCHLNTPYDNYDVYPSSIFFFFQEIWEELGQQRRDGCEAWEMKMEPDKTDPDSSDLSVRASKI